MHMHTYIVIPDDLHNAGINDPSDHICAKCPSRAYFGMGMKLGPDPREHPIPVLDLRVVEIAQAKARSLMEVGLDPTCYRWPDDY